MPIDPSQTQQANNRTINIYTGGQAIDGDIVYEDDEGNQIFLPAQRAGLAAIVLEYSMQSGSISFLQPMGIFIYNNKRYDLPLKHIYYEGKILDFESGVNSLVRVVPGLEQGSQGMNINQLGAVIYLSEKTKDTLFSQLYLMDDPNDLYPTIILAHTESDYVVKSLKSQGLNLGEFVYFQGLRGPIKIWEVNYPENVLEREEFLLKLDPNENWALLDDLEFTV